MVVEQEEGGMVEPYVDVSMVVGGGGIKGMSSQSKGGRRGMSRSNMKQHTGTPTDHLPI